MNLYFALGTAATVATLIGAAAVSGYNHGVTVERGRAALVAQGQREAQARASLAASRAEESRRELATAAMAEKQENSRALRQEGQRHVSKTPGNACPTDPVFDSVLNRSIGAANGTGDPK